MRVNEQIFFLISQIFHNPFDRTCDRYWSGKIQLNEKFSFSWLNYPKCVWDEHSENWPLAFCIKFIKSELKWKETYHFCRNKNNFKRADSFHSVSSILGVISNISKAICWNHRKLFSNWIEWNWKTFLMN